ncbi:MAG: restriction endonuclease [Candidatus Hodarchaeales archaeon]
MTNVESSSHLNLKNSFQLKSIRIKNEEEFESHSNVLQDSPDKDISSESWQNITQQYTLKLFSNYSLTEKVKYLFEHYPHFRQYQIVQKAAIRRGYGQNNHLDYLLIPRKTTNRNNTIGVIVKDWQRACGYQIIFEAEKILRKTRGLSKILVISNYFSEVARARAKKLNIITLSNGELVSIFNSEMRNEELIEP